MQLIHLIAHFSSINLLLRSVAALIISEHGERFFCCWRSSTIRRWKLENEVDDLMEEMWSERAASRLTFFSLSIWNTPVSRCCKKMKLNSCVNEYFRNQNFHSGLVRISSSSFLPSLPSLPALTPLRSARVGVDFNVAIFKHFRISLEPGRQLKSAYTMCSRSWKRHNNKFVRLQSITRHQTGCCMRDG